MSKVSFHCFSEAPDPNKKKNTCEIKRKVLPTLCAKQWGQLTSAGQSKRVSVRGYRVRLGVVDMIARHFNLGATAKAFTNGAVMLGIP